LERQLEERKSLSRRNEVVVRIFVLIKQNLENIPPEDPVWDIFYKFLKELNDYEWSIRGEAFIREVHKATKHQIALVLSRQKSREKKVTDTKLLKEAHGFIQDPRANGEIIERISKNPWKKE